MKNIQIPFPLYWKVSFNTDQWRSDKLITYRLLSQTQDFTFPSVVRILSIDLEVLFIVLKGSLLNFYVRPSRQKKNVHAF